MPPKSSSIVRPRVNAKLLEKYTDQIVTIIGTVDQIDGSTVRVVVSDGTIECVAPADVASFVLGDAYELIGKVSPNKQVKIYFVMHLSHTLDPALEDRLLKLREGHARMLFNPTN